VEKHSVEFKSEGGRIKSLGEHTVQVQIGDNVTTITVIVKST
jgi:ribosomal protein L9